MLCELAKLTDALAVDKDLVGVVEAVRHLQRKRALCFPNIDLQSVPRKAGVPNMSASGPAGRKSGLAVRSQIHIFPSGIIEVRLRPGCVVTDVKLPRAGEFDG